MTGNADETLDILVEIRATPREHRDGRLRRLAPAVVRHLAAGALAAWEDETERLRTEILARDRTIQRLEMMIRRRVP
jgi:hypothetical protein